jgi:hypothetical protein
MKTLVKTLAVVVAMANLATAQEKASKPDIVDTADAEAYAKLVGSRAGEEREFEIAPGVNMTFGWCPAGEFMMGSPTSEEGRESRKTNLRLAAEQQRFHSFGLWPSSYCTSVYDLFEFTQSR